MKGGWNRFMKQKKYTVGGFYFVTPDIIRMLIKKAGFKTIYVNEIDKNFTKTLTHNNKEDLKNCIVDIRPIEDVNFKEIRNSQMYLTI